MLSKSAGPQAPTKRMGDWEFIALTAFMMSLVALSIDMMMPALPLMAADLGVQNDNDRQMILTTFMAGLTVAQFFYGPWSDRVGRKPAVITGTAVFLAGSVICLVAQDFHTMLGGRFMQGCGIAALRILSMTIVRDLYEGRAMARIMSMAMSLFILVPCVAPMLGQVILSFSHWRSIFMVLAAVGILVVSWYVVRQQETLDPSKQRSFNIRSLYLGLRETCSHRVTLGYTLASGLVAGAFTSYLLSAQQIFQDIFHSGEKFALYFAVLAMGYGIASLLNAKLVMRFGMHKISYTSITSMIVFSAILLGSAWHFGTELPLPVFMTIMMGLFFSISFLFGNMNAIAMQPLGHLAGTASSVISLINGSLSLVIGASIGQAFNGTIMPFALGCVVCSSAAMVAMRWGDAETEGVERHVGRDSEVTEQLDQAA
ncbi:multidrug effflux MFS transporter [Sansalvadorimonas sp. 2012CJ34-2]|uniref:Bcr/CflA family efflux transporter n=1 Tax=Parendozoicomonas callyspongiae TaxID=2942213 RepID=A0ABT0PL03_9GAMM|nr:multidrug effflux MFS transporter [Sansalvadorimonas sp. 2012CJ34-2]MCL6272057.1 multidrug effflux MFS transporter [Sansalvadorimonas sp. 2012CJ34-2]